jgi:outer membrane immunogenic protein
MKKTTPAAALALALLGGTAFSADLPSRAILPALPALPMADTFTWSGFYAGLNAGGAWNSNAAANLLSAPVFVAPGVGEEPWAAGSSMASARTLATQSAGFIGGGQIGYNWRVNESFVLGMEADIQGVAGSADSGTNTSLLPAPTAGLNFLTVSSASKGLDYLGTVRGRVGYLVTPTLLAYATGGFAYGGVTAKTGFFQTVPNDQPPSYEFLAANNSAFSNTRVGWTVGGGVEWLFCPNWSVKLEYLYYDLGNANYSVGITTDRNFGDILLVSNTRASTRFDGNVARVGVNYHFDWAPASAIAQDF